MIGNSTHINTPQNIQLFHRSDNISVAANSSAISIVESISTKRGYGIEISLGTVILGIVDLVIKIALLPILALLYVVGTLTLIVSKRSIRKRAVYMAESREAVVQWLIKEANADDIYQFKMHLKELKRQYGKLYRASNRIWRYLGIDEDCAEILKSIEMANGAISHITTIELSPDFYKTKEQKEEMVEISNSMMDIWNDDTLSVEEIEVAITLNRGC